VSSEKLFLETLGLTVVLLVLAGCDGTQVTPTVTSFPTSALTLSTPTPMPLLQPMSIRGILLDMEGNPVINKPVLLCYESESSVGAILEPVPQNLETKTGAWAGATDVQGVFVLGPAAGQPHIHPSSDVPGDRYTLVIGLTPRSGEWHWSCSPYVLQGEVYFEDCHAAEANPEPDETLWFTLQEGEALDLGTMTYVKEGTESACCK
jgi:hypothetical protein